MTYLTHMPKLSHAWRERAFRVERAQARESVGTLRAACDVLVRVSTAHLDRNYVDYNGLETCGRQIVKLSTEIRGLSLIAGQPDAPRHEPVSVEKTVHEARTYAGVKASRLVRVLGFIRRLLAGHGDIHAGRRILGMSRKLVRGLDVYGRVKTLIGKLADAVDNPAEAITPRVLKPKERSGVRSIFKWETSPQDTYGWKFAVATQGYDPRTTNVYWLEKQATSLKRVIYRDYHGLGNKRPSSGSRRSTADYDYAERRTFEPLEEATRKDEIWPPIDLVRMVEERRAANDMDAELRESSGPSNLEHHDTVSGSHVERGTAGEGKAIAPLAPTRPP